MGRNRSGAFVKVINPETLLTSHEAGKLIQFNPTSVNKWIEEDRIPAFRTPGGHRRIKASDLVAFLDEHKMPVPEKLFGAKVLDKAPAKKSAK